MPLYVSEFLGHTSHLTRDETGAYLLLLANAWIRNGKLPDDDAQLARMARATPAEWSALRPVLAPFFEVKEGFWVQHRLLLEKDLAIKRSETRRRVGALGGRPKSQTNSLTNSLPKGSILLKQNETPSPVPSPVAERESETPFPEVKDVPTIQDVLHHAFRINLAEWKARDWFDEMEGGGWLDHQHRKIVNWQSVLNRVRTKWEADGRPAAPPAARQPANGAPRKPYISELKAQLDAVKGFIAKSPANSNSTNFSTGHTPEQRTQLQAWIKQRNDINQQIATAQ